ncbi:MAG: M1 family metallopeptidase [Planctomycetes bacterium]|nr:M1 family metallopeptidase [Planctomycetota bacterium]
MRLLTIALCVLTFGASPLFAVQNDPVEGESTPGPGAHYTIHARVDTSNQMLEGEYSLQWTNSTDQATGELWFHLHHNAYANNRTTHLTEAKGYLRGLKIEDGWGWQKVTQMSVGGVDLLPSLTFEQPDRASGNGQGLDSGDRTVFKVLLPDLVEPGGHVLVNLKWESKIPRVRRRTGIKDEFLLMSHWFPKLGVYEGAEGWNCHQFHMNTEFFADYGTYDVTLNLPEAYGQGPDKEGHWIAKVGASGGLAEPARLEGGRLVVRFLAPTAEDRQRKDPITGSSPVLHGFAWTADPRYRVHTRRFVFDEWAKLYHPEVQAAAIAFGKSLKDMRLRDVEITVLIHPEREGQWERHAEATAATLFFYGLWWGEYPYEKITVVDPAWGAGGAGGMEYPTLFTAGTQRFTSPQMHQPEGVTVHEAGHQFWYGLVGNNEYEAAWMDEGFNSFTDSEVMLRHYGPRRSYRRYSRLPVWGRRPAAMPTRSGMAGTFTGARWNVPNPLDWKFLKGVTLKPTQVSPFIEWWQDQPGMTFVEQYSDPRWGDRSGYLRSPDMDPIETKAFEYANRSSYRTNSYPRTAVALRTLQGLVGNDAFLRGMRHYADSYRYKHPKPADFYQAFQEGAEQEVQWYFQDIFQGTGTVDWSVTVASSTPPTEKGWFLSDEGDWVKAGATIQAPEAPAIEEGESPEETKEEIVKPDKPLRHYNVVVRRRGTLRLPLPIQVRFSDDTEQTFDWSRELQDGSMWWRLPIEPGLAEIDAVILDPDRGYFLDMDMSDNQWFRSHKSSRSARWSERAFTQYSHLLHFFSTLGG